MNIIRVRNAVLSATAVMSLLVGFPALCADDKVKNDKPAEHAAPPPKQAAQPARAPAPANHPAPAERVVRPAPNTTRPDTQTTRQPNRVPTVDHNSNPNNGRPANSNANSGYNPNNGRPANSNSGYNPNASRPANTNPASTSNSNANSWRNNAGGANNGTRQPAGQITKHPNGSVATYRGANNNEARFRRDGTVHVVRANNMTITHGPAGGRRIAVERADHTRIVTNGAGHGYVERPFRAGGRDYYQRTYYVRGAPYTRVYRSYYYGGAYYPGYVPLRYYSPAFYGWVYSPWRTPVYYRWGWAGDPWYGYYGGYFTPYPAYSNPSFWLTDYLMAATLQEAYQERMDAAAGNAGGQGSYGNSFSGQTGLTPEVKQAIADEVQRQVAAENTERQAVGQTSFGDSGSAGLPILAGNTPHVFVVSSNLDVTADGQECVITQGDVLKLNGTPPQDAVVADVVVMASKGQDCRRGSIASVSLQDLQEMQNHMRETIDQGLGELQANPGQGGLPKPPAAALRDQVNAPFAGDLPPLDTNAAAELTQQAQEATQAEQDVLNQASGVDPGNLPPLDGSSAGASGSASAPTLSIGLTIDQVVAILGAPKQIADLGAKKIYVYKDMKITFMSGRVSDIQ